MEDRIINSSRYLHSLVHTVLKSLLKEAERIVERIAQDALFPASYILDLGMTYRNGMPETDVIEINPIGCAMCYVNNSVFCDMLPELSGVYHETRFGYEYCFDILHDPGRYKKKRNSGYCPEYIASDRYEFL